MAKETVFTIEVDALYGSMKDEYFMSTLKTTAEKIRERFSDNIVSVEMVNKKTTMKDPNTVNKLFKTLVLSGFATQVTTKKKGNGIKITPSKQERLQNLEKQKQETLEQIEELKYLLSHIESQIVAEQNSSLP